MRFLISESIFDVKVPTGHELIDAANGIVQHAQEREFFVVEYLQVPEYAPERSLYIV